MDSGDSFWNAFALAMFTMAPGVPRSIHSRTTSCINIIGARTLTANVASKCSVETSSAC